MRNTTTATISADLRVLEQGLIGIGLAFGSAVLVVTATEGVPVALGLGMAGCLAVIVGLALRTRRVPLAPEHRRLGQRGIAGATAVYAFAVALFSAGLLDQGAALMMAMATATPTLLAAHAVSRPGRVAPTF